MSDLTPEERAARVEASRQAALEKLRARRRAERDRLLSFLTEESWRAELADELEKPYWEDLVKFLMNEDRPIFPPDELIFSALNACPFNSVKAVILGQDPYHGRGQAHGMCFSVNKGVAIPPSLANIYTELASDIPGFKAPRHGYLMRWAKQGVLLLNTVLTVAQGAPNSHADQGWEKLTDAIIQAINQNRSDVVFLLWGAKAQAKKSMITSPNHVLTASHPSPYSADKFFGCRHFSRTNDLLQAAGIDPIDWNLEDGPVMSNEPPEEEEEEARHFHSSPPAASAPNPSRKRGFSESISTDSAITSSPGRSSDVCYQCNESGHWASQCPNKKARTEGGDGGAAPFAVADGPVCQHNEPSKTCTVRKEGPNQGRQFYGCAQPRDTQCKFFQWLDEPPRTGSSSFGGEAGTASPSRAGIQKYFGARPSGGAGGGGASNVCFKCNETGHWARDCPNSDGGGGGSYGGSSGGGGYGGRGRGGGSSYGGGGGGGGSSGSCYKCNESGHWARDCPNASGGGSSFGGGSYGGRGGGSSFGGGGGSSSRPCYKCNETGHWARDCPSA